MTTKISQKPYQKPLIKSSKIKPISLYRKSLLPGTAGSETVILAIPMTGF
jgi:hypothetical protein